MVKRVRCHYEHIDDWQKYENVADPCFFAQIGVDELQDEPGDAERHNANHYHAKGVYNGVVNFVADHRYGVEQSPYNDFDAEQKEAAYPAVAHIAEPEQAQDIGDGKTNQYRQDKDEKDSRHMNLLRDRAGRIRAITTGLLYHALVNPSTPRAVFLRKPFLIVYVLFMRRYFDIIRKMVLLFPGFSVIMRFKEKGVLIF